MLMNKILRFSFVALMAMVVGNVMADSWEKASSIAVGDVVLLTVDNSSVTSDLKVIKSGSTPIGDIVAYERMQYNTQVAMWQETKSR